LSKKRFKDEVNTERSDLNEEMAAKAVDKFSQDRLLKTPNHNFS